jgi:predicted HicB family RNase H-like nuclease
MTNINIEIPNKLHRKVKIQSAIDEVTLKDFIIKTLEEKIKKIK